jgi:Cu+-exporting ATPase
LELHAAAALGLAALGIDLLWGEGAPVWLAPWTATASLALLAWGTWRREELVWRGPTLLGLLAPLTATLGALGSLLVEGRAAHHCPSVAGAVCFAAAASLSLVIRERQGLAPLQLRLERALLPGGARRPGAAAATAELRPGEEFLLEPGERSPADAVIVGGRAQVEPWFESPLRVARQEGDTLLAGARVVDGALRSVVRWAGMDRAWARLTLDPDRRADRHTGPARLAVRLSTSGALLLAVLGALLAFSSEPRAALALCSAAALAATLASIALPELVALQVSSGVHQLLARGISFRGPAALDQAARTAAVVFCAEGTLLADEPSVASIEPAGSLAKNDLLALLAGAFAGVASPAALALQRCAQAYQVRPDATRSPSHAPGLGVTAVASTGQSLVVGTRALLLGRRISVAGAETRIAELEALGRSVLLAALDGRYVGLLALQDGIAAGGRAAVQYLIDAEVEAILLSGEARDTCMALAHHLGIDHIRPEVSPDDRASELRRLADSTPGIAVVGRASKDDMVLGAVPLSINIVGPGGALERWDIDVASGDARDAAWAVHLARKLYADTARSIAMASAPALIALLASVVGSPAWLAPLAGVTGSALAIQRLKRQSRRPAVASAIRQRAPAASS